ncbi:hypothetical protein PINS_up013977 [Pythium insidiosum]|nr:hypothetical protein PINS_up013977 [Pythium insidiosum]
MNLIRHAFGLEDDYVSYTDFCAAFRQACEGESNASIEAQPAETVVLLRDLHLEFSMTREKTQREGHPPFDFHKAFSRSGEELVFVSPDDLKEVLWAAGVRHPYLREELELIVKCFGVDRSGLFDVAAFCKFMDDGPSMFFRSSHIGVLDGIIARLKEEILAYLNTSGKDAEQRLLQCFREFDSNGDGVISHDEFEKVLHHTGLRHFLSAENERLLLQFLDTNDDGVIAYTEFVDFIKLTDERLNADCQDSKPPTQPSPPSPTKAAASGAPSPRKPGESPSKGSPAKAPPSPHSPSGRPTSPGSGVAEVIARLWKLNLKLQPRFPFEKYLTKYRLPGSDANIKTKVFIKILDKFLSRLVEHRIAYNMKEIDIDELARAYKSKSDNTLVSVDAFLSHLNGAQRRFPNRTHSPSSSSDEELSCSSDEEASIKKHEKAAAVHLSSAIRRVCSNKGEQEALRNKVKLMLSDIEKRKKSDKFSEMKVFKFLTDLQLRFQKAEADVLLKAVAVRQNGDVLFNIKKLGTMIIDQLTVLIGDAKKPDAQPTTTEKKDAPVLPGTLCDKIYSCFLSAAQKNVSGRKLLEKCDSQKTGFVTVLEFQTVMCLMGCSLTESELNDIKKVLGAEKAGFICYKRLLTELTKRKRAPKTKSEPFKSLHVDTKVEQTRVHPFMGASAVKTKDAPVIPSTHTRDSEYTLGAPKPSSALSKQELERLDAVVRVFASDRMGGKIDKQTLHSAFGQYDLKMSGFVSHEAFIAVMRKLDIPLADDIKRALLERFTVVAEKFDYVDFAAVVAGERTSTKNQTAEKRVEHTKESLPVSDYQRWHDLLRTTLNGLYPRLLLL